MGSAINRARGCGGHEVHAIRDQSTWLKTHLIELIRTIRSRVITVQIIHIRWTSIKSEPHDEDPTIITRRRFIQNGARSRPLIVMVSSSDG